MCGGWVSEEDVARLVEHVPPLCFWGFWGGKLGEAGGCFVVIAAVQEVADLCETSGGDGVGVAGIGAGDNTFPPACCGTKLMTLLVGLGGGCADTLLRGAVGFVVCTAIGNVPPFVLFGDVLDVLSYGLPEGGRGDVRERATDEVVQHELFMGHGDQGVLVECVEDLWIMRHGVEEGMVLGERGIPPHEPEECEPCGFWKGVEACLYECCG